MIDTAIVVSAVSGTLSLVAATGAAFIALRSKNKDYENDYYKQVLQRRIEAYSYIEKLILNFKTAVPVAPNNLIHIVFSGEESDDPCGIHRLILDLSTQSFWLSDEMFAKSREIDLALLERDTFTSWHEFGVANYQKFAVLRVDLEELYARDLGSLHMVPRFLRHKRHDRGFNVTPFPPSVFIDPKSKEQAS
ncbi:hypothetical protein ACFQBQ_18000 [Granulicella cerasi]|uniref:Uncharacterized protein n=1 Tax=Granulicella cerasi TaxID=741063 RepID=A0ABW1ZDE6_9BACT|nr:hypothetical protein [Granulicella cerasi]